MLIDVATVNVMSSKYFDIYDQPLADTFEKLRKHTGKQDISPLFNDLFLFLPVLDSSTTDTFIDRFKIC